MHCALYGGPAGPAGPVAPVGPVNGPGGPGGPAGPTLVAKAATSLAIFETDTKMEDSFLMRVEIHAAGHTNAFVVVF